MSSSTTINVHDYVNHPYERVRDALAAEAVDIFSQATQAAARRARTVASELHVNIVGIEIGTDINITVRSIKTHPKKIMSPAKTCLELEWEAAEKPHLFPFMQAELCISPLGAKETQLELKGDYRPPLGLPGRVADAVVGHRIAEASVRQFIRDVAAYLRTELADPV